MDQIIDHFIQIISSEWATVTAHSEVFAATLAIGLFFGWTFAWLILKNRLAHHKELVATYEAVIAEKIPALRARTANVFSLHRMLLGIGVLVLIIVGPLYLLIYLQTLSVASSQKPDIQFESVQFLKLGSNQDPSINARIANVPGSNTIPAINMAGEFYGVVSPGLTSEDIVQKLQELKGKVEDGHEPKRDSLQNSTVMVATIPGITVSEQQLVSVIRSTSALYIFFVIDYQDERTKALGFWRFEFCGYYISTFAYWHVCGPNHPEFIKGLPISID